MCALTDYEILYDATQTQNGRYFISNDRNGSALAMILVLKLIYMHSSIAIRPSISNDTLLYLNLVAPLLKLGHE